MLSSRAFIEKAKLEDVVDANGPQARFVWLEDIRDGATFADKVRATLQAGARFAARPPDDPAVVLFTSGSEGAAQRRRAVPRQHSRQHRADRRRLRFHLRRHRVQPAADLPRLRSDRRSAARSDDRDEGLSLSVAASLSADPGAGLRRQRHRALRHRHVPRRLCPHRQSLRLPHRCVTSFAARNRSSPRPGATIWRNSAYGSSKATASPRRRRCSRSIRRCSIATARSDACCRSSNTGSSPSPASTTAAGCMCAAPMSWPAIIAPTIPARSRRRITVGTIPATSSRSTRRIRLDQGTRQAFRQNRRRNGLAGGGRADRRGAVAGRSARRRRDARPEEGRAHRPGDDQTERDPRRGPGMDENQGRFGNHVSGGGRHVAGDCRCSAPARPTTSPCRKSCASRPPEPARRRSRFVGAAKRAGSAKRQAPKAAITPRPPSQARAGGAPLSAAPRERPCPRPAWR